METRRDTTRWSITDDMEAGTSGRRGLTSRLLRRPDATRAADRLTTGPLRQDRSWLTRGARSDAASVLAPGVRPEYADTARRAIDDAAYDVINPLKPSWFRKVEPIRALLALVPAVVAFAVAHTLTGALPASLAVGLLAGWPLGRLVTGTVTGIARRQAGRSAAAQADRAFSEHAGMLRPLPPSAARLLEDLLDRPDVDEARLHHLAFQAAGADDAAARATTELRLLAGGQPVG